MRITVLAGIAVTVIALVGAGATVQSGERSACDARLMSERADSRDGTRAAVVRCTPAGIGLYVTEQGRERRLAPSDWGCCYRPSGSVAYRDVAWAPDGERLAVVIDDLGGVDVWVIDVERLSARRVTAGPARERHLRWSDDGSRVVYLTETGVLASAPAPPLPDSS